MRKLTPFETNWLVSAGRSFSNGQSKHAKPFANGVGFQMAFNIAINGIVMCASFTGRGCSP